jgi:hypothetical protein
VSADASLTGAALLAALNEQNAERTRRDWFRLGAKFAVDDTMPDASDEEREAALAKVLASFDRFAADRAARIARGT